MSDENRQGSKRSLKERITSSRLWRLLAGTFSEWTEDKASRLAAALSYYTVFSMPALLLILVAVAGFFLSRSTVRDQITSQVSSSLGSGGAQLVQGMLNSGGWSKGAGVLGTILGVVTLLFGATNVFNQLQQAMNTIWEVKPKKGRGIWPIVRARLLSFGMLLLSAVLLMVFLIISTGLSAGNGYLPGAFLRYRVLLQIANNLLTFGVVTLLFAMMFKYLPDAEVEWKDVWVGALVTGALFTIGKWALGLYLGHSGAGSAYGVAGSLILILLWVYYSAQIFFVGAEFTQVYARLYGSRITPDDDAVRITDERRESQAVKQPEEAR